MSPDFDCPDFQKTAIFVSNASAEKGDFSRELLADWL